MKVVICVDESKTSEDTFKWYCKELHQATNQTFLVHAGDEPKLPNFVCYEEAVFPKKEFDKCVAKCKAKAEAIEKTFLAIANTFQIKCQFQLLVGNGKSPGESLTKFSNELPANVVIVGTRGMGKLRRTVLGSVSSYLIHHAHMPVLVYKE